MAEVLSISSQGQYPSGPIIDKDIIEISDRLANATTDSTQDESKEELAKDEGPKDSSLLMPPRRAATIANYLLPTPPISRVATPSVSPKESADRESYFPSPVAHLTPPTSPNPPAAGSSVFLARGYQQSYLSLPHRSYSVMDVEPIPFTHKPGATLQLGHLPPELHYAVFDFLDPIDSVCLALTAKHFYAIHWTMRGKVSLAARREGPNDMEWVWRNAGPFLFNRGVSKENSLAMLSPRGQVYCRKCRTARCELHKHIKDWIKDRMGNVEYCAVTEKFGPPAQEDAKGFCYRSSPRHPNRCGRHTRNQRQVRLV
ncbi:hypothetical protein GGR50DRAFT_432510 [Xylaria sp. CBS 124048]|nr:hypothetical protein GGR50DRAFT_432510 [Xylaria sp. CBS 124048]